MLCVIIADIRLAQWPGSNEEDVEVDRVRKEFVLRRAAPSSFTLLWRRAREEGELRLLSLRFQKLSQGSFAGVWLPPVVDLGKLCG